MLKKLFPCLTTLLFGFIKSINPKVWLGIVLLSGFLLRIYGLNWDQGYHLHPDERMITMVAERLGWPSSFRQFISADSPLNPKFFAYGSFPIYLLRASAFVFPVNSDFRNYTSINLIGRLLSALFDTGSILLIFLIARCLFFSTRQAIVPATIYASAVLPIQLSHFFAVDTLLNFFVLMIAYLSLAYYQKPGIKTSLFLGLFFGLALTTKISALPVALTFGLAYLFTLFKLGVKVFSHILFFLFAFVFTFIFTQPYAIIDFPTFRRQIEEQSAMTRDAYVFPYTLQYVGTLAYLYPLKNITFFGFGVGYSFLSLVGLIFSNLYRAHKKSILTWLIFCVFYGVYFILVGKFSVKFMRYYLPLYSFLAILACLGLKAISSLPQNIYRLLIGLILLVQCFWLMAFLNIYHTDNTRLLASNWISQNISPGSVLLREHWDDGLPLYNFQNYQLVDLPLYDTDTPQKWAQINQELDRGDYLIIASNRLYIPLQKLSDCQRYPKRCYPQTGQYYRDLFSGKSSYHLAATFASEPRLFGLTISDFWADESFTVYDHPKILIYKHFK